MEPQFTLKNEEGEKLVYQCNLCKPKPSVISVNVKSRSNLKRHLSAKHGKQDLENYEKIKKKKTGQSSTTDSKVQQSLVSCFTSGPKAQYIYSDSNLLAPFDYLN